MASTAPHMQECGAEKKKKNFEGGGKFIKHQCGDKSQQTASASQLLSIPPTGRRGLSGEHDVQRLQVTDMSHHLKPCGTIIPPSL